MDRSFMSRRAVLAGAAGMAATLASGGARALETPFGPPGLIEAARKEGSLVYYTANFAEGEREVLPAFNKRFPFIRGEMVRPPGGPPIPPVQATAAPRNL